MCKAECSTIHFPADPTNPGHFFACCGLLEVADRIWPGVEGWFENNEFFIIHENSTASLCKLLTTAHDIQVSERFNSIVEDDDERDDSEREFRPLLIESPIRLHLDWWQDKTLKPWAGSMNARNIFLAMCNAIDSRNEDPLNQKQVVFYADENKSGQDRKKRSQPNKREPFYFDSRRGANALAIDVGFSPDAIKLMTLAHPVVEALSFIGLQRSRPRPADKPRIFEYFTWRIPMPIEVMPLAVLGYIGNGKGYRFENAFRTDKKKHKAFSPASAIGEVD